MHAATREGRTHRTHAPSGGGAMQRRPRCLLAPVQRDLSLTRALLDHLSAGLAGVEFTASAEGPIDSVWVCGYDERTPAAVRALRQRFPQATLLVSHRGFERGWQQIVLRAGANHALHWPVPTARLARLLAPLRG